VTEGLGSGWLTDDLAGTLVRFDPATGRALGPAVRLPGRPTAVLTAFGRVWVASMLTDTVTEVGPGGAGGAWRAERSVRVPAGPSGLAAAGGRLWVASVLAGAVSAVDPSTARVVAEATLPGGAVRIAAGAGRVWVTGTTDSLADVGLRPSGATVQWRAVTVGQGPLGVAVGDGSVWVADSASGTVSRVDPTRDRVTGTYRTGPDPVAVAVSGGRTWVADGRTGRLQVVGPADGRRPFGLTGTPRQLVAVPGGLWAAVANPGAVAAVTAG
jgi:hypothetical protein